VLLNLQQPGPQNFLRGLRAVRESIPHFSRDVHGVLGKEVRSSSGENIGRIVDVLVDKGRQISLVGALMHTSGYAAPETKTALNRPRSLIEEAEEIATNE
jgi:hypothetical protein